MKKVLYVLIGLAVLYLILALFGPKEVTVERHVTINAPAQVVKEKLVDFKFFHDTWSPWTALDPNMKTTYTGNPGEVGSIYTWSGNKDVGKGEMEFAGFNGDTILQKLRFDGSPECKAYYIVTDNATSTDVAWGMHMTIGFLGRAPMLFMNMDKMMGGDFEKGLANMKESFEKDGANAPAAQYQINEQQWEEKTFAGTKPTKMNAQELSKFFGESYPKLFADMKKNKLESSMGPSAIYYSWDEKTMDTEIAAVMCLPAGAKMPAGWDKCVIPASKVLHVAYYGAYDKSAMAHMAIEKHVKEKGLTKNYVIEEYVTDPMSEKDTTKWLTNIYYVLKS